jgi:phosphonoacetaldehyde hydrolase
VGLSLEELERLGSAELTAHRERATRQLAGGGAHFVIDSAAHLEPVIDEIERRLARGERP